MATGPTNIRGNTPPYGNPKHFLDQFAGPDAGSAPAATSACLTRDLEKVSEIVAFATDAAKNAGAVKDGDIMAVTAGMPFAQSGSTNLLRIFQVGS